MRYLLITTYKEITEELREIFSEVVKQRTARGDLWSVGKENLLPNHRTLEAPSRGVKVVDVTEAQLARWLKDHSPYVENTTVVPLMLDEEWQKI